MDRLSPPSLSCGSSKKQARRTQVKPIETKSSIVDSNYCCLWRQKHEAAQSQVAFLDPIRVSNQIVGPERRRRRDKRKGPSELYDRHSAEKCNSSLLSAFTSVTFNYLLLAVLLLILQNLPTLAQQQQESAGGSIQRRLPDLTSGTSDEPIVAIVGQDAFISCVAKNLQNYTIIWRYTNEASAPGISSGTADKQTGDTQPTDGEMGAMLTAGRQRVISDDRFSVIHSHDTWLLKISNVRLSDTGTYICHTNSDPKVRVLRILSVIRPNNAGSTRVSQDVDAVDSKVQHFSEIDYNFSDCCRAEYVVPRCQRLCSFQQLASRYQSINIVHECYSALPSISRCMVAGRNVTDCCQRRHIPDRCKPMCGHLGDTSAMSVQDQSYCADYSASIMSCVAEGISSLPGQPELVIVEAVSSSTLKVSWQRMSDENELRKVDGWIINLTKLSSFEDTIAATGQRATDNKKQQELPSSFSSSSSSSSSNGVGADRTKVVSSPLMNLTIVDVLNNSSLAAMTKLLAASSGTISLKLEKNSNEFSIENLKPYTVYQIQMFAYNSLGRSQLTDPIRALTLAPDSELQSGAGSVGGEQSDAYVEPSLPDTRKCCSDRGVTLRRCLDTLCDPVEADKATIADLMICAPWSNITFSCVSSRVNHTDCCKARGVSPFCLSMCSGEVKRVDYRHFRCLTHMSSYTNCILESHNVLPSAPLNFTVGPITHTWAVLNWRPPRKHSRSLQGYRIYWRRVEAQQQQQQQSQNNSLTRTNSRAIGLFEGDTGSANDDFFYSSAEAATNPYLLDALQPESVYETFVVAVNKFGQSESSVRFVFQTLADPERVKQLQEAKGMVNSQAGDLSSRLPLESNQVGGYNETQCCANGGVHLNCLQLCDYQMKVSDVSSLITTCNSQMPVIMRCMAGSRNSVPCCRSRKVADHCLNVCAGLTEHSPLVVATRCAADFGKIIRCMDEGSQQIPSAPVDLHTADIKSNQLTIEWKAAKEDSLRSDVEYHVRYQQLQQANDQAASNPSDLSSLIAVVPLHPLEHNLVLTTNSTRATLDKLRPNSRYSIYVTSENSYGISLPSLVLVVQTPPDDDSSNEQFKRRATLGAPQSLEILKSDTESIVLKWIAPLFINNDAQIRYRIFYKLLSTQQLNDSQPSEQSSGSGEGAIQQVASNWTVLETADTSILLRNLRYSSQYVITVQAFSRQMLGHMSEILLASTAKPVPPTLNHPLVINNPVEGNNITIMCVALGQPTPQISMFINGLLVQKRTQPYVIYHLVNLVRGQLTITCFASNGHGKDYASVQSRTEISVKFPSRATAKVRNVRAQAQSIARLSCEVSGNPQPTVVWTHSSQEEPQKVNVLTPNERLTTLLVSQFESPFSWTHTLTLSNVSQADYGTYQCRSKNVLSESMDSIQLEPSPIVGSSAPKESLSNNGSAQLASLKQLDQQSDLMDCCRSQNVSAGCLPVCSADGLDVESAFKTAECQPHLDKLMYCAADGSDHRNCCRTRQVPSSCLRWCSGAKLNIPALCFLSSAVDINQCFQEGRSLLPGPPRNVRVLLASDSEHSDRSESSAGGNGAEVSTSTSTMILPTPTVSMFDNNNRPQTMTSNEQNSDTSNNNSNNNSNNPSVISTMAMMMGDQSSGSEQMGSSTSTPAQHQQQPPPANDDLSVQHSEPLIIEWDPPSKNPALVQYYRIFWRPFGSRELSRTVTNLTWIKLNDLDMNKIYEFVVKAANSHGSSVYSDPLTVKPAEIMTQSNSIGSAGLIWFMPSMSYHSGSSIFGRVMMAVCFATIFMFGSFALVMFLEKKGYLKGFASSKSNSSRISFANPAYLKDSDGITGDGDNITWNGGHSLDILSPPASTTLPPLPNQDQTTNSTPTTPTPIVPLI